MITIEPSGMVRFRVYVREADRVQVVGGFTGWTEKPIDMRHTGEGWWEAAADVPPGDWRFRYLIDGWRWATDFAAHGIEHNTFGSLDSCLLLARRSRRAA